MFYLSLLLAFLTNVYRANFRPFELIIVVAFGALHLRMLLLLKSHGVGQHRRLSGLSLFMGSSSRLMIHLHYSFLIYA